MKKLISSLMAGIIASTLSVAAIANTPPQNEKAPMHQQMDKKAPTHKQVNKKHHSAKAKKT